MKAPRGSTEPSKLYQNLGSQVVSSSAGSVPIPRLFCPQAGNSGDHGMSSDTDSRPISPGLVSSHHRQTLKHTYPTRGTNRENLGPTKGLWELQ